MYQINELDIHRMDNWLMYGFVLYMPVLSKNYVYYWKVRTHGNQ